MGFASDSGYTPATIADIMASIMANINTQFGTTYTTDTFVGTNFYKYFYALAQRMQENEIKTSEIFLKLQDYFAVTNEKISRPVVTNPGLVAAIEAYGYNASVKAPIDADAGKVYIAIDVDETAIGYAATKIALAGIIRDSTVAGTVTQGTESTNLTLSNGQSFAFKFKLPNRIAVLLRLTTVLSANNKLVIKTPDVQKAQLIANIKANYRIGRNFEPQKYYTTVDAPWAQSVLLEYSTNSGSTWASTVYSANYDDLFVVTLANITLVES